MASKQVRVQLNGTWHTLTLDSATGQYKAKLTAPGTTSYNLSGRYYPAMVEVSNTAGTVVTATAADMESLRLIVHEIVRPVISVTSPTAGAFLTGNVPEIIFTVTDEAGGSGVNLSSVSVKLDGTPVEGLTNTAVTNGYQFSGTAASALSDGAHTLTVEASDNDGNAAAETTVNFTVDTLPPDLTVTFPGEDLETNTKSITVTGMTNDATSSPVTVTMTLNGDDQGAVTVAENGSFANTVTLLEGTNALTVTSTDRAGKSSSVSRTVVLDTSVPVIKSATIAPNPVDTGATVVITVELA